MAQSARSMFFFLMLLLIMLTVESALSGPGLRGTAIGAESSKPAINVQQPDPFFSPGEKWIEITDPQGQKRIIREKTQKTKQIIKVKGSVIMIRGNTVIIRMAEKGQPVEHGNRVDLSYSVDGDVIPVGTWRVSLIREDGTVEALPFEIKGQPNIGMDAVFFVKGEEPQPIEKLKPSEKEKGSTAQPEVKKKEGEKAPIEKEPRSKSMEEILASYSKTAVPIAFSGAGESLPCASGTIQIHPDKIEIKASGESKWDHCIFKVSDELFDNFFATFKLIVDTNSHHHFHVGIAYGKKPGGVHEFDSIRGSILALSRKTSSGLFRSKRDYLSNIRVKHPSKDGKGNGETIEKFLLEDSNPTPGSLAIMKTGHTCRIFWNGEETGSWEEKIISNGHLWLEFMAHGNGRIRAAFEDIRVYRLK